MGRLTPPAAEATFVQTNMLKAASKPPADLLFRAFSDRTRLRILHLLQDGELCVCDLVSVIGAPQPKVSRHLAYLRKAHLVTVRKQGLWSYYAFAPASSPFHSKLLDCLGVCFGDAPVFAKDAAMLEKVRRSSRCDDGGCCE